MKYNLTGKGIHGWEVKSVDGVSQRSLAAETEKLMKVTRPWKVLYVETREAKPQSEG